MTVTPRPRTCGQRPALRAGQWTSIWASTQRGPDGRVKHRTDRNLNIRTNAGIDWQSRVMAGDTLTGAQLQGTASATTATSLTTSGLTASALVDHIIAAGPNAAGAGSVVYGVVTANTTTLITVDRWYNPASPSGAAGTTPNATAQYQVLPGSAPAAYLALSTTVQSGTATDTVLAGEIGAGDGLARAYWSSYAHSAGVASYTLTKLYTATTTKTVNSEALFTAASAGTMPFESAETSPPTLVSGDTLTQNVTVSF